MQRNFCQSAFFSFFLRGFFVTSTRIANVRIKNSRTKTRAIVRLTPPWCLFGSNGARARENTTPSCLFRVSNFFPLFFLSKGISSPTVLLFGSRIRARKEKSVQNKAIRREMLSVFLVGRQKRTRAYLCRESERKRNNLIFPTGVGARKNFQK